MFRSLIPSVCLAAVILLSACKGEPAGSIVAGETPDRTTQEPIIREVCKCAAKIKAEAWIDQNENGRREPEEAPLKGVTFRVEWYDDGSTPLVMVLTSDESGSAAGSVAGCGCDDAMVYAQVPVNYRLTTPDRCQRECSFGFAALPTTPQNLSGASLIGTVMRGENLIKADLSSADLSGADLSGADLLATNLREANLRGASLIGANLIEADFTDADLSGADLSNAELGKVNLSGADLSGANLSGAHLLWPDLRGTVIDDATLIEDRWRLVWEVINQGGQGRHLGSVDLSEADLQEVDLSGAYLGSANLSGTLLGDANLTEADLTEADLTGADLSGADLSNADLNKANLSGADLSGANLSGASLLWPNLRGTVIDDATLIEDRWRLAWEVVNQGGQGRYLGSADLSGADLQEIDLSGAYLGSANLSGTLLYDADLSYATLSSANLGGANLARVDLHAANLKMADLSRADLSYARLDEANLSETQYDRNTKWPDGFDPAAAGATLVD